MSIEITIFEKGNDCDNGLRGSGNEAKRQAIHQSDLWHRGAHIFLRTPENKFLVQKRSKRRVEFPSALDCSVSERIKPGESYIEGAIRGLYEELGSEPVTPRYLMGFKMNYGSGDNMISTLYEGSIDTEIIQADPKEINQIKYYYPSEVEQLLIYEETSFSHWFKQLVLRQ